MLIIRKLYFFIFVKLEPSYIIIIIIIDIIIELLLNLITTDTLIEQQDGIKPINKA